MVAVSQSNDDDGVSSSSPGRPVLAGLSPHTQGAAMLTIQNASQRDDGVYVCVAKNRHSRDQGPSSGERSELGMGSVLDVLESNL